MLPDSSEIKRTYAKAIKADYVKRTITVQLEASIDDFDPVARDTLSKWAEVGQVFRAEFFMKTRSAPLFEPAHAEA